MKCPYLCNGETIHHVKPVFYQRLEVENADCTPDVLHCTANDYGRGGERTGHNLRCLV